MHDPEIIQQQRNYFKSNVTLPYEFRLSQLKKLLALTEQYELKILEALYSDLHKSRFEAWGVEAGVIETELKYFIRHLKAWMQPKRITTPLFHFRASSFISAQPYGNTLIIAPWNYPFLLSLRPLIGAIAAGNTAIIKPSENAPATAAVIEEMINRNFDPAYLKVVMADAGATQQLLEEKFDFIFFTGGTEIGRSVYQAAAKHLTPVALELGGKNPCIIDEDVNIKIAASRVAWGKFSNCGQTCVAPDYVLIHDSIYDAFIAELKKNISAFFGDNAALSNDYGRIINARHFERIAGLMQSGKIIYGGAINAEEKYIGPALMEISSPNVPVMQEEIFGPLLPVIRYRTNEDILTYTEKNPDPLVLYIFSQNKSRIRPLSMLIPSGDLVVNEVVLHFGHLKMPIGGRGTSGIGKYQGRYSFDEFSHHRGELHKRFFPDLPVRYPPYSEGQLSKLKWLFKNLFGR